MIIEWRIQENIFTHSKVIPKALGWFDPCAICYGQIDIKDDQGFWMPFTTKWSCQFWS